MTRARGLAVGGLVLLAAVASGCDSKRGAAPSATPPPSAPPSALPVPSAAEVRAAPSAAPEAAKPEPLNGISLVEGAKITQIVFESRGRVVAELERAPPARAWLTLSTKAAPLAPRAQSAFYRIAEHVAPGIAAPTALRALRVVELTQGADPTTRKRLEKTARVLANGTVEVALTLAPSPALTRVDLADIADGRPAWEWEMKLDARDAPPEAERRTLALYQSLLVADYVAANGARRFVHLSKKSGRMTAAEGNDAYTAVPLDDSVHDALNRISRYMVFSKQLRQRLKQLDRASLEAQLRWGDPPTLLITPKQLEESVDRAHNVLRLIDERVKQRGEAAALALP